MRATDCVRTGKLASRFPRHHRQSQCHRQRGDNDGCRPGHKIEKPRVDIFAHQFFLVDEQEHEDQHKGQHDTIQHLRPQDDFD